jgi:hypothetical protein
MFSNVHPTTLFPIFHLLSGLSCQINDGLDSIQFLEHSSIQIVKIAIPVIITLIADASLVRFIEQKHALLISIVRSNVRFLSPRRAFLPLLRSFSPFSFSLRSLLSLS